MVNCLQTVIIKPRQNMGWEVKKSVENKIREGSPQTNSLMQFNLVSN